VLTICAYGAEHGVCALVRRRWKLATLRPAEPLRCLRPNSTAAHLHAIFCCAVHAVGRTVMWCAVVGRSLFSVSRNVLHLAGTSRKSPNATCTRPNVSTRLPRASAITNCEVVFVHGLTCAPFLLHVSASMVAAKRAVVAVIACSAAIGTGAMMLEGPMAPGACPLPATSSAYSPSLISTQFAQTSRCPLRWRQPPRHLSRCIAGHCATESAAEALSAADHQPRNYGTPTFAASYALLVHLPVSQHCRTICDTAGRFGRSAYEHGYLRLFDNFRDSYYRQTMLFRLRGQLRADVGQLL
jgi:hypothetical protein